jgi:alpha-amylase
VVGLDLPLGEKTLNIGEVFGSETKLRDCYSNQVVEIKDGQVKINSPFSIVLLEKSKN